MKYLLGVDFGGTASKATLLDTTGRIAAEHTVEYPTYYPKPGVIKDVVFFKVFGDSSMHLTKLTSMTFINSAFSFVRESCLNWIFSIWTLSQAFKMIGRQIPQVR